MIANPLAMLITRWEARQTEYDRLDAHVNGAKVVEELLADLRNLELECERDADHAQDLVTLAQAARETGFTADHLGRLVSRGEITNHGRKHAPRVRVSECPHKDPRIATRRSRSASSFAQRARVIKAERLGVSDDASN